MENRCVVGDQAANMFVAHSGVLPAENKIKSMTVLVRGLNDVLNKIVALQQLRQLYVDVYVEVAADQYGALVDCQQWWGVTVTPTGGHRALTGGAEVSAGSTLPCKLRPPPPLLRRTTYTVRSRHN